MFFVKVASDGSSLWKSKLVFEEELQVEPRNADLFVCRLWVRHQWLLLPQLVQQLMGVLLVNCYAPNLHAGFIFGGYYYIGQYDCLAVKVSSSGTVQWYNIFGMHPATYTPNTAYMHPCQELEVLPTKINAMVSYLYLMDMCLQVW